MKKKLQLKRQFFYAVYALVILHSMFSTALGLRTELTNDGKTNIFDLLYYVLSHPTKTDFPSIAKQYNTTVSRYSASGIFPHTAVFGNPNDAHPGCCHEVGIGAAVSWANRLWSITYAPHRWNGGQDGLYSLYALPSMPFDRYSGSVGGTHSARMIHVPSNQLIIGPYFIRNDGTIRAIKPTTMPGRITGVGQHLTDPSNKVYFYTMEQGLYEVNVNTLAVTQLHVDANAQQNKSVNHISDPIVHGAHGKGAYSGQNRFYVVNNGYDPIDKSGGGVLAEWNGTTWREIDNQGWYTDVSSMNGLSQNVTSNAPIWAIGWDRLSAVLQVRHTDGSWKRFRFPKGSNTFDSGTGWYTEWPRIHKIGTNSFIMDLHGTFFRFPNSFSQTNTAGISPLSTHLSIVNSIESFNNQLVLARNDTIVNVANSDQTHQIPQSNFEFTTESALSALGRPYGNGAVWLKQTLASGATSDPFFIGGYNHRTIHIYHASTSSVTFTLQIDQSGTNTWTNLTTITVPAKSYNYYIIPTTVTAPWLRVVAGAAATEVTAHINLDSATRTYNTAILSAVSPISSSPSRIEGILRPRDQTLQFVAKTINASGQVTNTKYYEMDQRMVLEEKNNTTEMNAVLSNFDQQSQGYTVDESSVILTEGTARFRLPKGNSVYNSSFPGGWPRVQRRVVADRLLLNIHGTFYELPEYESGGVRKIKPITTHNRRISDFTTWRGMLVLAGTQTNAAESANLVKSLDGQTSLWIGSVDDLWKLGNPSGIGGPWNNTEVIANTPSDPYLMAGYNAKRLSLSHTSSAPIQVYVDVDIEGNNTWSRYANFTVNPGGAYIHDFPEGYNAHWVRLSTNQRAKMTATFLYGDIAQSSEYSSPVPHYCVATAWTSSVSAPSTVKFLAYDSIVLPDKRLKQQYLSADGKSVWVRYYTWNGTSWTLSQDWSHKPDGQDLPGTAGYRSYDHIVFPNNDLKQTVLSIDGKTMYFRYLKGWNATSKSWNSVGAWEQRNDLPNSTDAFRSFDHFIFPDNRLKQSALGNDGKTLFTRYLSWNTVTSSFENISDWIGRIDTPTNTQAYLSFDHRKDPDNKLTQSVLDADGRTLHIRTLDWITDQQDCP